MVPHGYLSDNERETEEGVKLTITEERKVKSLKELSARIIGPEEAESYFGEAFTIRYMDPKLENLLNYDYFKLDIKSDLVIERRGALAGGTIVCGMTRRIDFPEESVEVLWQV